MTVTKSPMTQQGADALRDELEHLKRVERPQIVKDIAEARAHGDLKENAEYHAAKERQGLTEARVRDIEHKLAHAQIIDISSMPNTGRVIFGVTVKLLNCDTDEEVTYQIVGEDEADLKHNKISYTSPIARGVIGKMVDDVVVINTPSGEVEYEIVELSHE